jgi:hypothetical protein
MSGGWKRAKPAGRRPLDGRVRRPFSAPALTTGVQHAALPSLPLCPRLHLFAKVQSVSPFNRNEQCADRRRTGGPLKCGYVRPGHHRFAGRQRTDGPPRHVLARTLPIHRRAAEARVAFSHLPRHPAGRRNRWHAAQRYAGRRQHRNIEWLVSDAKRCEPKQRSASHSTAHRRLTFDMSGAFQAAKPAGERPLDGRVRRH